jgi:hypothetical protein
VLKVFKELKVHKVQQDLRVLKGPMVHKDLWDQQVQQERQVLREDKDFKELKVHKGQKVHKDQPEGKVHKDLKVIQVQQDPKVM